MRLLLVSADPDPRRSDRDRRDCSHREDLHLQQEEEGSGDAGRREHQVPPEAGGQGGEWRTGWGSSTAFDLISEHTLISEHPPPPHPPQHFVVVNTAARAHRDICVLAVLLCCIMQSIFYAN